MKRVRMHVALAWRGGASRVARLIAGEIRAAGWDALFTHELAESGLETPAADQERQVRPEEAALWPGQGKTALAHHIHSSTDWLALLEGWRLEADAARRNGADACLDPSGGNVSGTGLVLTLHDGTLLTGGCLSPLGCPARAAPCVDPCPRGFANVARRQERARSLLEFLNPLLVCPSAWMAKQARARLPDCACRVIPNGVEDPLIADAPDQRALPGPGFPASVGPSRTLGGPARNGHAALAAAKKQARAALGIAAQAQVLLFAAHGGPSSPAKGGDRWRALWAEIKAALPRAVGIMAGGTETRRENDLLIWPYVPGPLMRQAMLAADVFLHASAMENHPLVILEAMAAGAAPCAFSVGGIPEQYADGECGRLAPPGKDADLAGAAVQLLVRPALLREWSWTARLRYERHFTAARMAGEYKKLYERILQRGTACGKES